MLQRVRFNVEDNLARIIETSILTKRASHPESHPIYPNYSHLLSPGWIPGRLVVST